MFIGFIKTAEHAYFWHIHASETPNTTNQVLWFINLRNFFINRLATLAEILLEAAKSGVACQCSQCFTLYHHKNYGKHVKNIPLIDDAANYKVKPVQTRDR